MSPVSFFRAAVALACVMLLLDAAPARAAIIIGGVTYQPGTPTEVVIAPFTTPAGGVTTNLYHGFVLLRVTGTGQSLGTQFNDAFYLLSGPSHDPNYYQLVVTKTGSVSLNTTDNAYHHIVYDVDAAVEVTPSYTPAFQASNTYNFVVNTALLAGPLSSILRFGVDDGAYGDNSGAYTIQVTQLEVAATPEPASIAAFGLMGVAGLGYIRRRLKAAAV